MRYTISEGTTCLGAFATGETVTIEIYDASDGSVVSVTPPADDCTEIGATGVFRWATTNLDSQPTVRTEYLYIMTDSQGNTDKGKIVVGGYPDSALTHLVDIKGAGWTNESLTGISSLDNALLAAISSMSTTMALTLYDIERITPGNCRTTLVTSTVQDLVRKVEIGRLDHITYDMKNNTDLDDFSIIRASKTLYAWYANLGDYNPIKMGENG